MSRLSSTMPFIIFFVGLVLVTLAWVAYFTGWKTFQYKYLMLPTVLLVFPFLLAVGFSQVWESDNAIRVLNPITQKEIEFKKGGYRIQPLFGGIIGKAMRIDVVVTEDRAFYFIRRLFWITEG